MSNFAWLGLEGLTLIALIVAGIAALRLLSRNTVLSAELRQKMETLHHAEQLGQTGNWTVDVETSQIHWSDRVFEIHGRAVSEREPSLEDAINYYHPDDRDMVAAKVERAMEDGVPFEFRACLVAEDGTERNVLARGLCGVNSAGVVDRIFGVFVETAHVIHLADFVNDNAGLSQPNQHG